MHSAIAAALLAALPSLTSQSQRRVPARLLANDQRVMDLHPAKLK